ncbi:hypothetical protein [Streptomyces sp. FH025]|uniref:hypothetical protein n=1 Tax=Streptomyces sp. FH025 TaxID=2815937 RepID=UPI001A9CF5D9|nr:hypothetical protein [Streptomyces sp. FH025]MBO1414456.1 hypothetical protein [Streptomyces sp. FH025]
MATELRAPLFVQQGRYDALDLRTMIGGTRGAHVGVTGPTALLVEKVDNPTPRVSVAAGSVWLPDDVAVSHRGAVHFANLDASVQLQCSTPKPGEAARTDLVVAFADPDSVPAGPLLMDIRTTADQYMQPVTYTADGTPYATATSGAQVTKEGAKGWSIAVLAESTPGAKDWPVPSNSVRLALVNIAQTGITGIEDVRFVVAGQHDTTPLRHLRTAGAQGIAQVAAGAPAGSLVYDSVTTALHKVTGPGTTAPVIPGAVRLDASYQAGDGAWGAEGWHQFTAPAAPYPRLVTVSFEASYQGNFGEGWITPLIVGHGERRRAGRPQYTRVGDSRDVRGTATIRVPAGTPLNVSTVCTPDHTENNNIKFVAAWTSYAEAIVVPAA